MSIATDSPPCTGPRRWKITVDEFERMVDLGVFAEDDPIELINGELYEMPPAGDWHNAGVTALNRALAPHAGDRVIAQVQNSVRLDPASAPEPDLALLAFRPDLYREGGVPPSAVLLVVEVSDSSAGHDRDVKLPLYARAGIPEAWIVTREPAAIEAYRSPREGIYTEMRTYLRGDIISPMALPDVQIAVSAVTG